MGSGMASSFSTASIVSAGLLLTGLLVPAVQAQDEDQIKDLLACDKIKKDADKLECFNAVIEILKQQEAENERSQSASGDRLRRRSVDVASPRGSEFGLSDAQVEARRNQARPEKQRSKKEEVFQFTRAWKDAVGKYYFLMSNGQVWKELKGSHLVVPKRAKTIRIKRNMMGGYVAFVEGMSGRKGRVKRIR